MTQKTGKEPQEELKDFMSKLEKEMLPEAKKMMEMAKAQFQNTTPATMKNIKVDGLDCVAQLFEDKVTIVFPAKDMPIKYYEALT